MTTYHDFRFRFAVDGLEQALAGFDRLRAAGMMGPHDASENQIGWTRGRGARLVTSPEGDAVLPAAGDPAYYYVAIRSRFVSPEQIAALDLDVFGLEPLNTPALIAEGEAVLGAWA